MTKNIFLNWIKIVIIIVLFVVIYYLQLGHNLKKYIISNWSYYKCQPYIIPFAGFFRSEKDKSTFGEFTLKNFQKCQWVNVKIFFGYFIQPLQYIIKIITKIIEGFRSTLNIFRAEARQIRGMFKTIVEKIANKLTNSYSAVLFYQAKMQNIIKKQLAILQLMMYFADSMKMTMLSLVNGPVIEMVKFLPAFGIALLVLIAICLACMFGGPFTKLVACPICLVCFNGNEKCILKDGSQKKIKDIGIGEYLKIGDRVESTFIFDLDGRSCDMYNYQDIEVSGSHIIYDKENVTRVENHQDSEKIDYKSRYIYCLNTKNKYILMKNKFNKNILFGDFYESKNSFNNYKTQKLIENKLNKDYLYNFGPNKDTVIHNYEWGLSGNTLVKMIDGKYKQIKDIKLGDFVYSGGKVYGLVKHCSNSSLVYNYRNHLFSGTQLVKIGKIWKRIYSVNEAKYTTNFKDTYLYHIVCDHHKMLVFGNIWIRDYLELRETDSVFDILLQMNLNTVQQEYQSDKIKLGIS